MFNIDDIVDYWKAPLHWAARNGYTEKLKTLIDKYKAENNLEMRDNYDNTPLVIAFVHNQYECAIMLLEAGANPYVRCRTLTLLHGVISYGRLELVRLLLWYDPAYEDIKSSQGKAAKQEIKAWAKRNAKNKNKKIATFPITKIIETTANDAKAVKTHLAKINEDLEKQNYLSAALRNKAIAEIFYHHYEIEKTIPFLLNEFYDLDRENHDRNLTIYEKSKPILIKFYQNKTYRYYQAYEEAYRQIEKSQLTGELQQQHIDILDRLITLSGLLDKEPEKKDYIIIASRLRHQANEVGSVTEPADAPLKNLEEVESLSGSLSEKEHLLPKQSDTYSILDNPLGLRKRAKSQATSTAESEDTRFSPRV